MRPRREYVWIVCGFLIAVAFIAGFGAGFFGHGLRVRVEKRTVTKNPYTHPDASVPGAQVNPQLQGLTCDVYQARHTVVCHP